MRHLLITGGTGQVGRALARLDWPSDITPHFPARTDLDLMRSDSVHACLNARDWSGIINCAAYTAVDQAENNVAQAFLVNTQGPAWLAEGAAKLGIPLVHLSTDYVFDGKKTEPYSENDPTAPVSAYGASKLAGELAVRAGNPRSVIVRTAWLLSSDGNNFLKTMLNLSKTHEYLHVVSDQTGNPTAVSDLAEALRTIIIRLIDAPDAPVGIYNFVNAGEASWYDLAIAIFDCANQYGMRVPLITPIASSEYPTLAHRPANSRLSTQKFAADYRFTAPHWRNIIADIVAEAMRSDQ